MHDNIPQETRDGAARSTFGCAREGETARLHLRLRHTRKRAGQWVCDRLSAAWIL